MRKLAIIAALMTAAARVNATPIVNLAGATQWQTAINTGAVSGVAPGGGGATNTANTAALNTIYPGQSSSFASSTVATNSTTVNGVVTQIGTSANQGSTTIGAFCYIGPDPDWTGFVAKFNPYLAAVGSGGVDMFSFAIIDVNNKTKAWTWDSTVLVSGFNPFSVHLSDGAGAGGSTGFVQDLGFDITQGKYIQFGFRGTPDSSSTGIDPFEDGTLTAGDNHLWITTPESSGLYLLCGGLIALIAARWWRYGRRSRRSCSSSC